MTVSLELGLPRRRPDLWDGLMIRRGTGSGPDANSGASSEPDTGTNTDPQTPTTGPDPVSTTDPDTLAALLRDAVHLGVGEGLGMTVDCTDAEDAARVLHAAVAALTGGDVPAALRRTDPDWAAITGLGRAAREAIRDVVAHLRLPADDVAAGWDRLPDEARATPG